MSLSPDCVLGNWGAGIEIKHRNFGRCLLQSCSPDSSPMDLKHCRAIGGSVMQVAHSLKKLGTSQRLLNAGRYGGRDAGLEGG